MSKILIIEDEESIRRVLNKVLMQDDKSYSITEAVDGLDGISKINSTKFDLILCDIKMPKKDGIEVLKHILTECPNTPTIMISGHGDLETAVESMRLGAFDYISKPPDLNRLLNSVRSALLNKNFVKKGKNLLVPCYHNWGLEKNDVSKSLDILAESVDGKIECIRHKKYKIYGIMWHPERRSKKNSLEQKIIKNFL